MSTTSDRSDARQAVERRYQEFVVNHVRTIVAMLWRLGYNINRPNVLNRFLVHGFYSGVYEDVAAMLRRVVSPDAFGSTDKELTARVHCQVVALGLVELQRANALEPGCTAPCDRGALRGAVKAARDLLAELPGGVRAKVISALPDREHLIALGSIDPQVLDRACAELERLRKRELAAMREALQTKDFERVAEFAIAPGTGRVIPLC